ncbi:MAG: DUF4097 domain-containing protein [Oscillospiraceae bacterium]|nr:DUF4097 domain-containing protein [Oscillospiraceae bacterium]
MLKKLFGIFIPLCIFSFIAFGISAAVLGTGYGTYYDDVGSEVEYIDYGIVDGGSDISSWELYDSYSDIRLDIGAYNVTLISGQEGDYTTYFNASRISGDSTDIRTELLGDTLVISIDESFKFINFGFDYLDRLFEAIRTGEGFENIFGGSRLDIIVPPQVYHCLDVTMGSGSLEVVNVNAASNSFYLGSGSMSFFNDSDFTSDNLDITVGSGYIQANGAKTMEYSIDINSGRYEIFGLSGDGELEINSGSGAIGFDAFDGNCDISMNSGTVDIYVPQNSSMRVDADINSGSVYVVTADHYSRLRDGDSVTIGGGENLMSVDLNSGQVSISEIYPETEVTVSEVPPIDFAIVTDERAADTTVVAIEGAAPIVISGDTVLIEAPEVPQAPEAPSAPKAPEAPSFSASVSGYAQG